MNKQNCFGIVLCVAFALLLLGSGCQEKQKEGKDKKPTPVNWPYRSYVSAYVDSAEGTIHVTPHDSARLARELKAESLLDSFWIIGEETLRVHLDQDTFGVVTYTWFPNPGDRRIYLGSYCGRQIPQRIVNSYERVAYRLWMTGTIPAHTVCAFHPDSGACTEFYRKLTDVNYYRTNDPHKPGNPPLPNATAQIGPYLAWTCAP